MGAGPIVLMHLGTTSYRIAFLSSPLIDKAIAKGIPIVFARLAYPLSFVVLNNYM